MGRLHCGLCSSPLVSGYLPASSLGGCFSGVTLSQTVLYRERPWMEEAEFLVLWPPNPSGAIGGQWLH